MKLQMKHFPVIFIFILFIVVSCGPGKSEKEKILNRTDPIAERMLRAIDQNNYMDFSSDFSERLKTDYNEKKFHDLHLFMKKSQGEFISKSFFSIIRDKNTITVQYIAVYKIKTPAYTLSLTFSNTEGTGPLSGFNFIPFNVSR